MSIGKRPFYYGGVVSDVHFCNRQKEINELLADIDAGLNVLLYAPRRFGKTSLVLSALGQTEYRFILLDLMSVVDTEEFINEYFNAISKSLRTTSDKVVDVFKKVLGLKPNIGIDFDGAGNPSFRLHFQLSESSAVLKEVLDLPWRYARHKNQKVVVVFDEFQEVVKLGIEDKLRSVLQHHGDNVSYVFLGSKKSIMKNLFYDKNKPFYKSVKHLPIDKISDEDWKRFIRKGFESHQKQIGSDCIQAILDVSKGFPYYTQQISHELFTMAEQKATSDMAREAVNSILDKEEDLFVNEWNHLSQYQKKALKLMIYADGQGIYSKEVMAQFYFTSSSLKKAVEGLLAKDVIDHKNGRYYFQDPLFEFWLKRMA